MVESSKNKIIKNMLNCNGCVNRVIYQKAQINYLKLSIRHSAVYFQILVFHFHFHFV